MFGSTKPPQSENSLFAPQSPYAAGKLYSYWITKFIEMHIIFMHLMVFYLITKVNLEEILS